MDAVEGGDKGMCVRIVEIGGLGAAINGGRRAFPCQRQGEDWTRPKPGGAAVAAAGRRHTRRRRDQAVGVCAAEGVLGESERLKLGDFGVFMITFAEGVPRLRGAHFEGEEEK